MLPSQRKGVEKLQVTIRYHHNHQSSSVQFSSVPWRIGSSVGHETPVVVVVLIVVPAAVEVGRAAGLIVIIIIVIDLNLIFVSVQKIAHRRVNSCVEEYPSEFWRRYNFFVPYIC